MSDSHALLPRVTGPRGLGGPGFSLRRAGLVGALKLARRVGGCGWLAQGLAGLLLWVACSLGAAAALAQGAGVGSGAGAGPGTGSQPGRIALDQGWAVLLDPDGALNPATLLEPATQARFRPVQGTPSLGYFRGAAWLRLTLQPQPGLSGERLLELQFPPIDEATLFWPGADGALLPGRTAGDRHPLAMRDFPHRNIMFRVQVQEGSATTFYLRLQGRNTFNFSVVLWDPPAFATAVLTEQMLWGFVLAVHVVLILSNLWFFQATRDAPHGLFGLFALTSFLSVLFLEGFGYYYLLDTAPALNDALVIGTWMLAQPMAYLFVLRFTGLVGPGGRRWARWLVACHFAFALTMMLSDQLLAVTWARPLFSLVQLLGVPLLAGILVVRGAQGVPEARQTLVAMLPVMVAVALRLARNLGLLEPSAVYDHSYYVGLVLYLLMLNFAISRRQESLRRAAEAAQATALETVQQSARQLEQRVQERTAEIAAAMLQVQGSLELERRLRAEQREFFATASHQMRTPLAVIDATVQNLVLQVPAPQPESQARLRKVLAATGRMASLLDRQLHDDRISGDGASPVAQPCDLAALMEDAAATARLVSDSHVVTVSSEAVRGPFSCDPTLTRLALGNLADNAVKYTPPGTRVVLSAQPEARAGADGVVLQVEDDGPGVGPADREQLLKGRFRAQATAGLAPGTGMGLLLASRMVQTQGGSLELQFPPEGGTVARLWLPLQGAARLANGASMGSTKV